MPYRFSSARPRSTTQGVRLARRLARGAGRALLESSERARLDALQVHDAGHGYDVFGLHRDWVALAAGVLDPLYRRYFRVSSFGTEHIPRSGPAILVANHAGTLPIDAAMLFQDVLRHTDPPRVLRCIADRFVPELPFAGSTLGRMGVVAGTPGNVRHLLEVGELCLIFPEGLPAIGKPWRERYVLRDFRVGFAELAMRCGAPVVPVAVIGSEEQWPQIGRLGVRAFGLPYLPIVATPLPLPVHYRIHYGPALDLASHAQDGQVTSEAVAAAARAARAALQRLVEQGLAARSGTFR
jgi:1-acyl-sn-glycerol-3-phosphate acyltransferase